MSWEDPNISGWSAEMEEKYFASCVNGVHHLSDLWEEEDAVKHRTNSYSRFTISHEEYEESLSFDQFAIHVFRRAIEHSNSVCDRHKWVIHDGLSFQEKEVVRRKRAGTFATDVRRFIKEHDYSKFKDSNFLNWLSSKISSVDLYQDIGVLQNRSYYPSNNTWTFQGDDEVQNQVVIDQTNMQNWIDSAEYATEGDVDYFEQADRIFAKIEANLPNLNNRVQAAKNLNREADAVVGELASALEPLAEFS
jgi:oligoribonuclease NrnB/cAMP/cGMP phosphodiesterase (DHH superfamily)